MKKAICFLILCIISFSFGGCLRAKETENNLLSKEQLKKQLTSNEIIEIVYNQLPKEQKEDIDSDLKEAKISKIILRDSMGGGTYFKFYIGKEVYDIEFKRKAKNVQPDNKTVFASIEDYKLIGYGYVD